MDRLVALGYLERADDSRDARRKLIRLTPHGVDGLRRSAIILNELRQRWADNLGAERVAALENDLRAVTPNNWLRLDGPGWFAG